MVCKALMLCRPSLFKTFSILERCHSEAVLEATVEVGHVLKAAFVCDVYYGFATLKESCSSVETGVGKILMKGFACLIFENPPEILFVNEIQPRN